MFTEDEIMDAIEISYSTGVYKDKSPLEIVKKYVERNFPSYSQPGFTFAEGDGVAVAFSSVFTVKYFPPLPDSFDLPSVRVWCMSDKKNAFCIHENGTAQAFSWKD